MTSLTVHSMSLEVLLLLSATVLLGVVAFMTVHDLLQLRRHLNRPIGVKRLPCFVTTLGRRTAELARIESLLKVPAGIASPPCAEGSEFSTIDPGASLDVILDGSFQELSNLLAGQDLCFGVAVVDASQEVIEFRASNPVIQKRASLAFAAFVRQRTTADEFVYQEVAVVAKEPWISCNVVALGFYAFQVAASETQPPMTYFFWIGFTPCSLNLRPMLKFPFERIARRFHQKVDVHGKVISRVGKEAAQRDWMLGISHDLRSPGNAALFAIRDLLMDESVPLESPLRSRLGDIEGYLVEQHELLADVFDVLRHGSRAEVEPTRRPVTQVESIVNVAFERVKPSIGSKELALVSDVDANSFVFCDVRHFRRILLNLVSNAVKYSVDGEVRVGSHILGDQIEISVSDTGIGVPSDEVGRLFTPFHRGLNGSTAEGVGLGLLVAKSLTELNKGTLEYSPRLGGGSLFTLRFERSEAGPDSVDIPTPKLDAVLICDDEPAVCRTYARYLRDTGALVHSVHSIADAQEALRQKRYDLVVTDLHFQDGDFVAAVESARVKVGEVPMILVSGAEAEGSQLRIRSRTAPIEQLVKPATRDQFFVAVNAALSSTDAFQRVKLRD